MTNKSDICGNLSKGTISTTCGVAGGGGVGPAQPTLDALDEG